MKGEKNWAERIILIRPRILIRFASGNEKSIVKILHED